SPTARTGRHVVDAIDGRRGDSSSALPPPPAGAAARQMLANVSYVQAMCWIAACVADALHFAHERGLVHLDLKPSNLLLATDGQPMLLDFHLARAPLRPDGPLPDNIGGTLPYMPAEQRAAMLAIQNGEPVEAPVDGRADIYALGAMLYESLGGQLPIDTGSPALSNLNPQVSAGLSDVVARCVADRSVDRYADARALADDLRRHLTDQPLAGVPNRSIRERWEKWRRRRPGALRAAAMLAITLGAAAALLGGAWRYVHDRHEQAEVALSDGQARMLDAATLDPAMQSLQRGIGLLRGIPFQGDLRAELRHQLTTAQRMQLARHLHHVADQVRVLYGVDSLPRGRSGLLAAQCTALWRQRRAIADSVDVSPQRVDDFRDVALFAAHISGKDEATRLLDEVEREFGRSAVLDHERQRHGLALSSTGAPSPAPNSAWEHYALGRSLLAADDLLPASDELAAAVRLDPAGCWPNFYYGLCAYRMSRHEDAIAAFSVCIGTSPDVAGCFYNRALAYSAMGRTEQALADYDRALQIDPTHAAAALNRGMMHFAQRDIPRAIADLNAALTHGADAATVHYDLAVVYLSQDDVARALEHAGHALETNPAHDNARKLRDSLRGDTPTKPKMNQPQMNADERRSI
ncbi:MAG: protein kinase family protein, partial [Tepidisphaeraceae bacterium]